MIQQKVRKKKGRFQYSCRKKVKLDYPMYNKQTNRMLSLKSLVVLKYEIRTSPHAGQYK